MFCTVRNCKQETIVWKSIWTLWLMENFLEMEIDSNGAQNNQEITSIGTQTDISHSEFSLTTKDQSTQFNSIRESIFKTEEDTETESGYSDHYSSCNESDTDFLQSHSIDSMEEGKDQTGMNSSAFIVFWSPLVVLLVLLKPN